MDNTNELLKDFIEWLRYKDDVFYAFDNTEDAVKQFINELNKE